MGKTAAARSKRTTTETGDPVVDRLAMIDAGQKFYGTVLNMGWRLAVTFLLPVILGVWLDEKFDTAPSYTITGIFLAVFGSVFVIRDTIRDVNTGMAAEEKSHKKTKKRVRNA
jgi:F0F1-type ATP synthase assembly protein I